MRIDGTSLAGVMQVVGEPAVDARGSFTRSWCRDSFAAAGIAFAERVVRIKCDALEFLIGARRAGQVVVGYDAAAKGNTFLNYCGIGPELVRVVADRSPAKQGSLLPGSRIPVVSPEAMLAMRPDVVLILPWNLTAEVMAEMAAIRDWGGRFATAIPEWRVLG